MYGGAKQGRLVAALVRQGRVPRYAVRLMPAPTDEYDPVNAFVLDHYDLEARLAPFEVFRRRPER